MMGTPDYIAPEQALDAAKADIRSDIYSLGCMLYFLLTGKPPFRGASLYELLRHHETTEARSLNLVRPDVPIELAAVVSKMMAKRPEKRFQSPVEVAKALVPFLKPAKGPSGPKQPDSRPAIAVPVADTTGPEEPTRDQPTCRAKTISPRVAPHASKTITSAATWENLADNVKPRSKRVGVKPKPSRAGWIFRIVVGVLLLLSHRLTGGAFRSKSKPEVLVVEKPAGDEDTHAEESGFANGRKESTRAVTTAPTDSTCA